MKSFACQYALLRFRPFAETGEFANVGVVLLCPEARFFGFRLLKRYGRITKFFHQLDRDVFFEGRELFKEELERFAFELRFRVFSHRESKENVDLARNLFSELVRQREAMLQFAEQRIVLAENPKSKLAELFDHYVERNFVTKEYQERLLENNVRRLLFGAHIGAQYQRGKIGTADFAVNFPFVRMEDGRPNRVIKPLHLAQNDSTKVLTHGGQWVDKIRRLRRRNALPGDVLFPLTAPAQDTRQYQAFIEIRDELVDANVQVTAANDDNSILNFASGN